MKSEQQINKKIYLWRVATLKKNYQGHFQSFSFFFLGGFCALYFFSFFCICFVTNPRLILFSSFLSKFWDFGFFLHLFCCFIIPTFIVLPWLCFFFCLASRTDTWPKFVVVVAARFTPREILLKHFNVIQGSSAHFWMTLWLLV